MPIKPGGAACTSGAWAADCPGMSQYGFAAGAAQPTQDAMRQAMSALVNRRPDQAEKIARDMLSRAPEQSEALFVLGVALLQQDRAREAIDPLERAAQARPDAQVEANLGIALRRAGRPLDALVWLERAIAHEPPFAPAMLECGHLLVSLRRFGEAETMFRRGAQAAPRAPEFHVALGNLFLTRSERDKAKAAFDHALALAPGHPAALQGLGGVLVDAGAFAEAERVYRQMIASGHADIQAGLNLGFCLLELGRWDEALATLRSIVAADPNAYPKALKMLVTSARGRFFLKPSAAMELLRPQA